MIGLLLPAALALALSPQAQLDGTTLVTMGGTCRKLVVADIDETARCRGNILNAAYPNSQSSFIVVVGDELIFSFYGEDHAATGDTATLTVRKVNTTRIGENKPRMADAEGECTYTNPNAGPSHIDCHATAGGKSYALSFVTDGKPPSIQHI